MRRTHAGALVVTGLAFSAVLGAMAWQVHRITEQVDALRGAAARAAAADAEAVAPELPSDLAVRVTALEDRLADRSTEDARAREMARAAHARADEAYAKALEPCIIHGLC